MTARLEVIAGPMFSGKTEELIRRYTRAEIAKQRVVALKPRIDRRSGKEIRSHGGACIPATPIDERRAELTDYWGKTQIFIDEVQFFEQGLLKEIEVYLGIGGKLVVSGLDMTYRREPFGIMPTLMAMADTVTKLSSVCVVCGEDAPLTQRLVDDKPATFEGPTVMIGGQESYEARCRECFQEGWTE